VRERELSSGKVASDRKCICFHVHTTDNRCTPSHERNELDADRELRGGIDRFNGTVRIPTDDKH
jgi:hypothetical protein